MNITIHEVDGKTLQRKYLFLLTFEHSIAAINPQLYNLRTKNYKGILNFV